MENNGVKYGLLAGLGTIIYTLILYLINDTLLFGWASFLGLVIYIVCMYKAGIDERNANGGFLTFKEALKPTFLTYVIGSFLVTLFTYILFTAIDPGLIAVQNEIAAERIQGMSGMIGEEGVEEALKRLEDQSSMKISDTLLGYAFMLIIGFVIAAIISAIIKKNRPEFA